MNVFVAVKVKLKEFRDDFVEKIDQLLYLIKPNQKENITSEPNTIVFVVNGYKPALYRFVKWVKKISNYNLVLMSVKKEIYLGENSKIFDEIIYFRNRYDLLSKIYDVSNVLLIHVLCPPSKYLRILKEKTEYTVIGDWKDISLNYYGFNPPFKYLKKDIVDEEKALGLCDGIVARSFEPQIAVKRYNIREKGRSIVFLDYSDNDYFAPIIEKDKKRSIELVYVGNIADVKSNFPGNLSRFINTVNEQGLSMHVYPSQNVAEYVLEGYYKIAEQNDLFSIHKPVNVFELPDEISQYDFGIQPQFTYKIERLIYKRRGSSSMKLFNYLEAGIPVIMAKGPIFQEYMISRYKFGITITEDDLYKLKDILQSINYTEMMNNVKSARETLSFGKNINRLIEYYESFK